MKQYIVDTNNILHADADLKRTMKSDPNGTLGRLVLRIDSYSRRHPSVRFILALDSPNSQSPTQSQAVTFLIPAKGETADMLIKRAVADAPTRADIRVVTNDTEVHNHARIHGVMVITPSEFLQILAQVERHGTSAVGYQPPPKPLGVSKKHLRDMSSKLAAPLDDDEWLSMMNIKKKGKR